MIARSHEDDGAGCPSNEPPFCPRFSEMVGPARLHKSTERARCCFSDCAAFRMRPRAPKLPERRSIKSCAASAVKKSVLGQPRSPALFHAPRTAGAVTRIGQGLGLFLKEQPWSYSRRSTKHDYEQAALRQGHVAVNSAQGKPSRALQLHQRREHRLAEFVRPSPEFLSPCSHRPASPPPHRREIVCQSQRQRSRAG